MQLAHKNASSLVLVEPDTNIHLVYGKSRMSRKWRYRGNNDAPSGGPFRSNKHDDDDCLASQICWEFDERKVHAVRKTVEVLGRDRTIEIVKQAGRVPATGGMWVKDGQVGSMNEKSQVRGCYNITFICAPTRKQCRLSPEMNRGNTYSGACHRFELRSEGVKHATAATGSPTQ